ncbi:MAG: metal-sensing transcriptional repressor [Pseudobutyrivibrio sp.]|nr:metal-sensing transcriptional repressor [Pseudobutyrivibrio sp.]
MSDNKPHIHIDENGNEYVHTHDGKHPHVHTNTKAVINRLNRAIGHLESVRNMVEDGRDCTEVLIQIAAVKSAINNVGKLILTDHIEHCIVDAIEDNDLEAIKDLEDAINKFIK